jgi:hypothetical protein
MRCGTRAPGGSWGVVTYAEARKRYLIRQLESLGHRVTIEAAA